MGIEEDAGGVGATLGLSGEGQQEAKGEQAEERKDALAIFHRYLQLVIETRSQDCRDQERGRHDHRARSGVKQRGNLWLCLVLPRLWS